MNRVSRTRAQYWPEGGQSKGVLFAEAAKRSSRAAVRHLIKTDTPSTEFSLFFNPLAGNNDCRADIIASPAKTACFGPCFEGHAHFSTRPSSGKSEGLSIQLFIAHSDAEATEDT